MKNIEVGKEVTIKAMVKYQTDDKIHVQVGKRVIVVPVSEVQLEH